MRRRICSVATGFDKEEVLAIAYYLYKLPYISDRDDVSRMLLKLLNKGKLEKKAGKLLAEKISVLEKKGLLHRIEENFTFGDSRIKYLYEEDKTVDREIRLSNDAMSQIAVDLYRLLVIDSEFNLINFIGEIFFDLTTENESIPEKYFEKIHDISKVKFLIKKTDISELEAEALLIMYRLDTIDDLRTIFVGYDDGFEIISRILNLSNSEFKKITNASSKLKTYGFIENRTNIEEDITLCILENSLTPFFSGYLSELDCSDAYDQKSFSVPQIKTDIMKNLIKKQDSCGILLYGKPGSGKTEYAKMLAKYSGKNVYIFKNESESREDNDALCRLNCFLNMKQPDTVLIIDEADNLLSTVQYSFFRMFASKNKGPVNKMLENNKNKTIWIINHSNQMDESTKRRFTYSCQFDEMPVSMMNEIAKSKLNKLNLGDETENELIRLFQKYKVTGSSVDNVVKVIESCSQRKKGKILDTVKEVIKENSNFLYGKAKMREKACSNYDISILNSSVKADKIVKMIENSEKFAEENKDADRSVRMLFYGLSGTGKTELVRYIAEKLGKEIILKRASDILDCFVGESEKNIQQAFSEAEKSGAILLFDEADSFFQDRNGARHSWEITQVNEFLTQMEEYNGILICTTNLRKIMDPAMQRRFHQLVEFKALTEEGVRKLLQKYFSDLTFTDEQIENLTKCNTVTPGDFASLKSRFRFMDKDEQTSENIISELETLQKEKNKNIYSNTAIGF